MPLPAAGSEPPERSASFAAAVSGGLSAAARSTSASIIRPSAPLPLKVRTSTASLNAAALARGEIAKCAPGAAEGTAGAADAVFSACVFSAAELAAAVSVTGSPAADAGSEAVCASFGASV